MEILSEGEGGGEGGEGKQNRLNTHNQKKQNARKKWGSRLQMLVRC